MKITACILFTALVFSISLQGQSQYTSVPRAGEGRFDRSNRTVFWANPIFFKPAVFFSASEVNVRANRKWWRNSQRILPKPFVADGYLPENFELKDGLKPSLLLISDSSTIDLTGDQRYSQKLLDKDVIKPKP